MGRYRGMPWASTGGCHGSVQGDAMGQYRGMPWVSTGGCHGLV